MKNSYTKINITFYYLGTNAVTYYMQKKLIVFKMLIDEKIKRINSTTTCTMFLGGVWNHWSGMVEWTTGMEYWNGLGQDLFTCT